MVKIKISYSVLLSATFYFLTIVILILKKFTTNASGTKMLMFFEINKLKQLPFNFISNFFLISLNFSISLSFSV